MPDTPPEDSTPMIVAEGLTRRHTTAAGEVVALAGVSFEIRRGRFVALAGPSGSGKTTLLDCLTGLDRPDEGTARIGDTTMSDLDPDDAGRFRRRHMATVFQTPALLAHLSAEENLDVVLRMRGVERRERRRRITSTLTELGLGPLTAHRPGELSGGQRQRVAIARALVTDADVLIADEPTAQLDTETALDVLDVLRRRVDERGTTMLVTTHDAAVLGSVDRTIHLVDGRLDDTAPDLGTSESPR